METVTDKFGLKWVLKPDWDNDIVRCVSQTGVYEGGMLKFVREVYPKLNADFYDIGAAFGYFTIHASKAAPQQRVLSFEPHPDHFKSLQQNVFYNDCGNVSTMNVALSDKVAELEVNNYKRDAGVCIYETEGEYPKVKVKTDLLSNYDLNKPRVLKLDTELAELEIMVGSDSFIRDENTKAIAVEFVSKVNYRLNIFNFLHRSFEYIYILDEDCGKIVTPDKFPVFVPQDILRPEVMNVVFMREPIA